MDAVTTSELLVVDRQLAEEHLRLVAGQATEGRIEIAWADANTHKVQHGRQFDIANLAGAADHACEVNAIPGCNVYVGAALRVPDVFERGRANDTQFLLTNTLHIDLDDPGAFEAARDKIKTEHPDLTPSFVVVTGKHPHVRAQLWWSTQGPVTDPERYSNALVALAKALNGDPTVVNVSRIMRLAGTIAWPLKPGRVKERTQAVRLPHNPVTVEAIEKAFVVPDVVQVEPPPSTGGLNLHTHTVINVPDVIGHIRANDHWHDNMVKLVGHWVSAGYSDAEIHKETDGLTTSGYTVEQTRKEVQTAIDGARKKGYAPRVDAKAHAQPLHPTTWPDPAPLTAVVPAAPKFSTEALPTDVARLVSDAADRMQVPPEMIGLPSLVTLAGLIGKDATLRPKALGEDWEERACLWGMIIAPKGSQKSQALRAATTPLRRIQKELADQLKKESAEWKELNIAADRRKKAYDKSCDKILAKDPDASLPEPPKLVDLLTEPRTHRILTADTTIEKLVAHMAYSRGVTLVRDELAGLLQNMSRYNTGSDRQFYLECHSGGTYTVDRVGRGEIFVPDLYLNIVGTIQPAPARSLFADERSTDDGLLERFGLMAFPEFDTDWRFVDRAPDVAAKKAVTAICDKLFKSRWDEILYRPEEEGRSPYARFGDAAQVVFNDWLAGNMRKVRAQPEHPCAGFREKSRGLLVRLALVLHLTAWAAGEEEFPTAVSVPSLSRAILLVDHFLDPTWERVMSAFHASPTIAQARRIAAYILDERLSDIRVADVTVKNWAGMDRKACDAAFDLLVGLGWLAEPVRVPGVPGRPSRTYHVNPKAHERGKGLLEGA